MSDNDFHERLQAAGGAGRPPSPDDLGPAMVARGRKRRRQQRVGQGVAAAMLVTVAAVGVTNIGGNTGAPIVTTPVATPGPSSTETTAPATPVPTELPVPLPVPTGGPTGDPSGDPSPSASATSSPSPSPRPSATSGTPGPSGGASDVGVTADTVTVHVVEQQTGAAPLPDPSRPIAQAVRAYALYVERDRGPIHGRQLVVEVSDGRHDPNSTRQAYRLACDTAFAAVGASMGPDEGTAAAQMTDLCGMPDLRSTTMSVQDHTAETVFSVTPYAALEPSSAAWAAWADMEPEAVGAAAWIRSDRDTQNRRAETEQAATEPLGYDWVVDHAYPVGDTSWYRLLVQQMQSEGVEFVHFDGDPIDAIRFAQTMQEQDFRPTLLTLAPQLHHEDVAASGGDYLRHAQVAIDVVPAFEHRDNVALERYVTWLRELDPGANPTTAGARAWAAMDLFVDSLEAIGPEPTREALRDHLEGIRRWNARGMVGARPQMHGGVASQCFVLLAVENRAWTRADSGPTGRLTCG